MNLPIWLTSLIDLDLCFLVFGTFRKQSFIHVDENNTTHSLEYFNSPFHQPPDIHYTRTLIAPLGYMLLIRIPRVQKVEKGPPRTTHKKDCDKNYIMIEDRYPVGNGTVWRICSVGKGSVFQLSVRSFFNVLHVTEVISSAHINHNLQFTAQFIVFKGEI